MDATVVIVGTGQGGLQVAVSLRELGHSGRIVLVGDEPHLPYQRPPLSKRYLLGELDEEGVGLRPDTFFSEREIEMISDRRAVAIDRARRELRLQDGQALAYDHLVLATGARNRRLDVPGADGRNVFYLRTLDEARALRDQFERARTAVVVGAGFVGLEFAASAQKRGLDVTVLDVAARPMTRAVSQAMSELVTRAHETAGLRFAFETPLRAIRVEAGRATGVETADGRVIPADLVMVGVGVVPNVDLAMASGLVVGDGIVVDAHLRTSDPAISAIGDVASFPSRFAGGARVRLESVQNAVDQARALAQGLLAAPSAYDAVPWFWSHQGPLNLQMAGLRPADPEEIVRRHGDGGACAVFSFDQGRLACVETLNRPGDHMLARRLLSAGALVTPQDVADPALDLKSLLPRPEKRAESA